MKIMHKIAFCAACLTLAGFTLAAGPLQRKDIPADPAWVLHADFDALRPTTLGQYLIAEMNKPENEAKLAAFQGLFKFDLRTQLHGASIYSVGSSPQDAIAIVYADFDADHLVTLAKSAKDSQNTTYKKHVIYNWVDDKKSSRRGGQRTYATIVGTRVLFGQRQETLEQALDVIDSRTENLSSSSNYPQLGGAGDVNFIEGAARKMPIPAADPNAALLKLSKSVRLQIGETKGRLNVRLALEANDAQQAGQMATVAQGLVALLRLQKENPEALKLADALGIKQDGTSILANLTLPSDEVLTMLKTGAARKSHTRKARTPEE